MPEEKAEKITVIFPEKLANDLHYISAKLDRGKLSKTVRRACEQYVNRILASEKRKIIKEV